MQQVDPSPLSLGVNLTLSDFLSLHNLTVGIEEENNDGGGASSANEHQISMHSCQGPSPQQMATYFALSWWLEGVAQTALGCLGFVANAIAIPILLSKEMSSIFNRLLTCLAVCDNVFIVCSVLEGVRKHIVSSKAQEYLFYYFLYQFHNMVLVCGIYITVVLALERYRAVWRPVEYHNNVNGVDPWRRVAGYIFPVVVFAVVFNLPKFFEAKYQERTVEEDVMDQVTGMVVKVNVTQTRMAPTALKLDDHYVLWYSNAARLVVTGIFPFASLTYLNYRIYTVIRRRRRLTNRPRAAASAAQKAEEGRQAIMLLTIVVLFLICHTLRIILNINGLFSLKIVRESLSRGCSGVTQHWTLIGASISHILLTINSSVNFVIYCLMCTTFRRIFYRWVNKLFGCRLPEDQHSDGPSGGQESGGGGGGGGAPVVAVVGGPGNNGGVAVGNGGCSCTCRGPLSPSAEEQPGGGNGHAIALQEVSLLNSEKGKPTGGNLANGIAKNGDHLAAKVDGDPVIDGGGKGKGGGGGGSNKNSVSSAITNNQHVNRVKFGVDEGGGEEKEPLITLSAGITTTTELQEEKELQMDEEGLEKEQEKEEKDSKLESCEEEKSYRETNL